VFLIFGGKRVDYDLDVLKDVLQLLDGQLDKAYGYAETEDDPDGAGVFETVDYLIGLGLVACQAYMSATYGPMGIDKSAALKMGPPGATGHTFAELVNDAANFWKHKDDWQLKPSSRQQRETLEGLAAMGCEVGDYPLIGALTAPVRPRKCRLQYLVTRLEAWQNALPMPKGPPFKW